MTIDWTWDETIGRIIIPSFAFLYLGVNLFFDMPIVIFVLGMSITLSLILNVYSAIKEPHYDGAILLGIEDDGMKTFTLEFDEDQDPINLLDVDACVFKVVRL